MAGEKLEIGHLSHTTRVALRALAMLGVGSAGAQRISEVEQALAGTLVRLGNGKPEPELFENSNDFPEFLSFRLAELIRAETGRLDRLEYLLDNEPDGGWRIKPLETGDEETLFKIAADKPR